MSHGNAPFGDGQEIIYVNGEYKGDDPIGRLVHDMWCKNADDMYYPELAEKVRYYKSTEKGRLLWQPRHTKSPGLRKITESGLTRHLIRHAACREVLPAIPRATAHCPPVTNIIGWHVTILLMRCQALST